MYFSLPLLSVLSLATLVVHAAPLPAMSIVPTNPTKTGEPDAAIGDLPSTRGAQANKAVLDSTLTEANSQLAKMHGVLANPTTDKNKGLIVSAFGQHAYDKHLGDIQGNTQRINSAAVRTRLNPQAVGKDEHGHTTWLEQGKEGSNDWKPDNVGFGAKFFDPATSTKGRAGTMIHEASHFAAHTSDHFDESSGKIVDNPQLTKSGYTSHFDPPKTPADVEKDTKYTEVRDSASNMHQNAESYSVLASLCDHARRDIHNFRRALEARDHEEVHTILRRNAKSCQLPPGKAASAPLAKAKH